MIHKSSRLRSISLGLMLLDRRLFLYKDSRTFKNKQTNYWYKMALCKAVLNISIGLDE